MKPRSLFDVINNVEKKPAKAKHKSIDYKKPIPIGHQLAIKVYQKGIYLDVLFADHINICGSHTMIHYNDRAMECYPVKRINEIVSIDNIWVFYENNTEFEIIRIN